MTFDKMLDYVDDSTIRAMLDIPEPTDFHERRNDMYSKNSGQKANSGDIMTAATLPGLIRPEVVPTKPPPIIALNGNPGIGKTTFATRTHKPYFLRCEDGCPLEVSIPNGKEMEKVYMPGAPVGGSFQKWEDLLSALDNLIKFEHDRKTVIVDTLNAATDLCADYVLRTHCKTTARPDGCPANFDAFGRGQKMVAGEMRAMVSRLENLRKKNGMMVLILCHEGMLKQPNVYGDDYHKIGASCFRGVWNLILGFCDQVGHATMDVTAVKDAKEGDYAKAKPKGSKDRWIYWTGDPGRDAKNRIGYELKDKMPLSYKAYAESASCGDWWAGYLGES